MLQMLCDLLAKGTHECEGKAGDVWTPSAGGAEVKKFNTMKGQIIVKNNVYEQVLETYQ